MQGVPVGGLAMRVGWTEEGDEQGLEKSRSRGGLWVMLRDETPRGFIEERRGEKEERGRGGEEKRRKKEEECRSWLCSNSKEHSRRTLSLSLSPRFFSFPFFVSLSFSLFQSCETGALQRDEKSGRPPVESCHGDEKRIFFVLSSPFFHRLLPPFGFSLPSTSLRAFFSSTLPSPPPCRLDADGITAKMIPRDFEAPLFDELLMPVLCTVERRTYLCYRKKNFMEVKSRAFDSPVIVPGEIIPIRITTHDPRKLFAD